MVGLRFSVFPNNDNFVNPLECFDPGLEPGGIIFYSGDKLDIDNQHDSCFTKGYKSIPS